MIIQTVPENSWKIFSAIFVTGLFLVGFYFFVVSSHDDGAFGIVWLGIIGFASLCTLTFGRIEIRQHPRELVKVNLFMGIIPLSSKHHDLTEFKCVKRCVKLASGYDGGSEGIYRPSIVIVHRDGNEILLQEFADCASNVHPLSQHWATKIAEATGLQVIDKVESW